MAEMATIDHPGTPKGWLQVMDETGDTKTTWDPGNGEEVTAARETFDALRRRGYTAYRVNDQGKPTEVMNTFDPQAGRIILQPAMQGG